MLNGRQGGRTIHLQSCIRAVSDKAVYDDICVQELTLDEGFKEIGTSAFSQCFGVVYLDLLAAIKTLKNNVFKDNNALFRIIIRVTKPHEATPQGSADGTLSVTAEGQISIYDLTGTLCSSGSKALHRISMTGETLLVVIQEGDTTLVRKVIVR